MLDEGKVKYTTAFLGFAVMLIGTMCTVYAQKQSFTFSPKEFQQRFNAVATVDGSDKIVRLKKDKDGYRALLSDESFQKSVTDFKRLDSVNGQFVIKTRIDLRTNKEDKIEEIVVSGDRADPINLFQAFIGTMGVIIKILDPALNQDQITEYVIKLGLARGDDDPTTGTVITQSSKGGVYNCLSQQSYVSAQVKCVITPRY